MSRMSNTHMNAPVYGPPLAEALDLDAVCAALVDQVQATLCVGEASVGVVRADDWQGHGGYYFVGHYERAEDWSKLCETRERHLADKREAGLYAFIVEHNEQGFAVRTAMTWDAEADQVALARGSLWTIWRDYEDGAETMEAAAALGPRLRASALADYPARLAV